MVLLDRYFPEVKVSYVALSNFNATYMATAHLLDRGYESPAMVAYDVRLAHMSERIRGYKHAMIERGLRDRISVGLLRYNPSSRPPVKLLSGMIEKGADAFLFATNMISLSCLHVLSDRKYDILGKLGLMGLMAVMRLIFFRSPLSYIEQPVDVIVQQAVGIIENSINKKTSLHTVLIEDRLVERDSPR